LRLMSRARRGWFRFFDWLTTLVRDLAKRTAAEEAKEPIEGKSRIAVVDEVWRMATRGELLTPEGW